MYWIIANNLIKLRRIATLMTMLVTSFVTCSVALGQRAQSFNQQLDRRISVTWQGQELATALERLASAGQIALWLDRRVDRQQRVSAEFVNLPLAGVLEKTAQQQALGFARLANIAYIGPEQSALEVAALIDQARDQLAKLPAKKRRRWLQPEATSWPRLSEPRTLAEAWLREANVRLVGGQRIAHDLWPDKSLPPIALVDRMVLLLAGFDLTCEIGEGGESCEVVAITRPLKLARRGSLPHAKPRGSKGGASHELFTLRLKNQTLGSVLDQFAKQMQLEVVWALEGSVLEGRQQARARLVSCDVENVELDALLQSVLDSAGLRHQRNDKRITIRANP